MAANPVALESFAELAAAANRTTFSLDGVDYQVGPVATPRLLDLLADADITAVVPGLCPADQQRIILTGLHKRSSGITTRLLYRIGCEVIGSLGGCPWWSAITLAMTLRGDWWAFDATARLEGVDLLTLPLPRALSIVYALCTRFVEGDKRAQIEAQVWERPVWADQLDNADAPLAPATAARKRRWSPEQQWASFQAFAALGASYNAAG